MSFKNQNAPYIIRSIDEDIEQHCDSLRHFSPTIRQLSRGCFQGHSTLITLPDCTLVLRRASAAFSTACQVPAEATFVFPLAAHEIYARGFLFGSDRQICSPGDHEAYVIVPEDTEYLMVTLPLPSLSRYLDSTEYQLFLDTLAVMESSPVDAQMKAVALQRLLEIFRSVESSKLPLDPSLMEHHSHAVINTLFNYLVWHKHPEVLRASNRERILSRALNLIEGNPTRLFTLEEISREVFASKRAVQYAFASITGLSPMRFQKLLKLNLVRNELKTRSGRAKFVSLAVKYSFSNAGRLGREYKELFGESPRESLQWRLHNE